MSRGAKSAADETFEQKLQRLRVQIDLLPVAHRPHLYELADIIGENHRRLQNRKPRNHDAR